MHYQNEDSYAHWMVIKVSPLHLSQLCWVSSLEWLWYFEHMVQSLLNTWILVFVLGATPNHKPLRNMCMIKISSRIRHVYLQVLGSDWVCFFMFSNFYQVDLYNEAHVVLANLWQNINTRHTSHDLVEIFETLEDNLSIATIRCDLGIETHVEKMHK